MDSDLDGTSIRKENGETIQDIAHECDDFLTVCDPANAGSAIRKAASKVIYPNPFRYLHDATSVLLKCP